MTDPTFQNPTHGVRPHHCHWYRKKLGDLCRIVGGSTPDSNNAAFWSGSIKWITPSDLGKLHGEIYIAKGSRDITELGYESCGTEMVPVGSVVMSSRAPIGHLAIAATPLCTNQGCKTFIPNQQVDSVFLYYSLKKIVPQLQSLGSGATFTEISKTQLQSFEISIPDLSEQRRIAAALSEQLAEVEKARAAVNDQVRTVKRLAAAQLRAIFSPSQKEKWPRKELVAVGRLLASRSIALSGDAEVRAITSACLTETGFDPAGVKTARMWSLHAQESRTSPGEILIARSNTPDLVGRVAVYRGDPPGVVASDLTIRVQPEPNIQGEFLAAYLSFLYTTGYWKERAGGASGTMKKITRSQIEAEQIPVPPMEVQISISSHIRSLSERSLQLQNQLVSRLETIEKMPGALLSAAFSGGTSLETSGPEGTLAQPKK